MIGAMPAAGCLNPSKPDATRMRLCNAAIGLNPWTLGRFEPGKSAPLWLERGIVRAAQGDSKAARRDMMQAYDRAAGGRTLPGRGNLWLDRLEDRIGRPGTPDAAVAVWASVRAAAR